MPSLWSWLSGRKHRITSSKHPEYIEHDEDRTKQRKHHHFGLKDKSKLLPSDRQAPLLTNQSDFIRLPPKSKEVAPTPDKEKKNDAEKVDNSLQSGAKRRLLAYEIFENVNTPSKNTEKSYFQPISDSEHNSRSSHEKSELSHRNERENVDVSGVEMRHYRYNIFGGLASKLQRHSLQAVYPGYGRDNRKGPEYRRSETMAGYIPRAVALHDASTILSGGIKEGPFSSKHMNAKLDRFQNSRDWSSRINDVMPHSRPSSSHQRQQFLPTRERAQHGNHHVSRHIKQSKVEELKINKVPIESSNKSRQKISNGNYATPSSSNGNFYFSSSMLGPILSESQTIDSSDLGDLFKEARTKSCVQPDTNTREHAASSNKNTKNGHGNNNNSSVVTKMNQTNSEDDSASSGISNRKNSDTKETVTRDLKRFEKAVDSSKDGIHNEHFDGIFNTDGEVLY